MTYVISGGQFHREVVDLEFEVMVTKARTAQLDHPDLGRHTDRKRGPEPLLWSDIQEMRELSAATRSIRLALFAKSEKLGPSAVDSEAAAILSAQLTSAHGSLQAATKALRRAQPQVGSAPRGEIVAEDLSALESAFKKLHRDPGTKSVASQLAERFRAAQKSFAVVQHQLHRGYWPNQQTKDLAKEVFEAHAELLRALEEFRSAHSPVHASQEPVDEKTLGLTGIRIALPSVAKDFRNAVLKMLDTYIPSGDITCH